MSICYWDGKCGACGHTEGKAFQWKKRKAMRCLKCGNEALYRTKKDVVKAVSDGRMREANAAWDEVGV